MSKIILTVDGTILKEVPLTKERVTIGRRSQSDLVIDHVAISSEHAVIVTLLKDSFLEDLNSTNGTQVNGQSVKKHFLQDNDVIELTPYKIKFVSDGGAESASKLSSEVTGHHDGHDKSFSSGGDAALQPAAVIRVLDGPSVGKEIILTKPFTTIGRPGVQIAVVTYRKQRYFITHVEGSAFPLVNGESIAENARMLKHGDIIDLSGTTMVFGQNA